LANPHITTIESDFYDDNLVAYGGRANHAPSFEEMPELESNEEWFYDREYGRRLAVNLPRLRRTPYWKIRESLGFSRIVHGLAPVRGTNQYGSYDNHFYFGLVIGIDEEALDRLNSAAEGG
jgi:hypothetical protein